ncbi:class I SAM-dependent methyltransferase [Erythrobacteraceae bacterium CFH 75059]|uniref:SAM-dependent methyltransferase n=1 Tax=Qipengyuania thermophila TaxID=2509361 RepID=UPI00101EEB11|nr:cyclopropane-fatty-acyl-phospholipid synthase family protein [Qipengyuania thermophila]TCD05339.1 class I SAM-dependent methyltransferase [Erythrobacteraceae bacterium CFH 75059]
MDVATGERGHLLQAAGARFSRAPGFLAAPATRLLARSRDRLLSRIDAALGTGAIHAELPDGTRCTLGGRRPGFECHVSLRSWRALTRLAASGSVGWYEAWAAGEWSSPDPVPLFALFMQHAEALGDTARPKGLLRRALRLVHARNRNTPAGAGRNIAAHYDLGNDFYAAWLDRTMSYSSAYGLTPAMSLEEGQERKVARLAERLGAPATLLEIGCGWGALADRFARSGAAVTAISLSRAQLDHARAHRLPSIAFDHRDYRDIEGQYDAIVSVEMVEALGREYWPVFLDRLARALKPGGRAALQFITLRDELFDAYARGVDFIQAYIFPGGLLVRQSEFRALAETRGLQWTDEERFGADYAETLRRWRERFDSACSAGRLPEGFDAQFRDLWRYYLMYCEGGFRGGGIDVCQVTLIKRREA